MNICIGHMHMAAFMCLAYGHKQVDDDAMKMQNVERHHNPHVVASMVEAVAMMGKLLLAVLLPTATTSTE